MSKSQTWQTLHSAKKQDWETPQAFFDKLDSVFHFDLDVCATPENAKCEHYYSINRRGRKQNGLKENWNFNTTIWCNPPYLEIKDWIKKAYDESSMLSEKSEDYREKATADFVLPFKNEIKWVAFLTFARTDTRWFQEYGFRADYAIFVKGRLKFEIDGVAGNPAPAPSVVLFFKGAQAGEFPEKEVEALRIGRLVKF